MYRVFARQPCCMAGTIDSFSYGKNCFFFWKTFSFSLPCNMATVQNLYSLRILNTFPFSNSIKRQSTRKHTILLSRERVNKETKRLNTLPLPPLVVSYRFYWEHRCLQILLNTEALSSYLGLSVHAQQKYFLFVFNNYSPKVRWIL